MNRPNKGPYSSCVRSAKIQTRRAAAFRGALLAGAMTGAVTLGAPAARAEIDIVEVGNLKITLGITGGVGGFGVNNVDFGRGNFNYGSGGGVRRGRGWGEAWLKPAISFEYLLDDAPSYLAKSSSFYGTFSLVGSSTFGYGDAVAGLSTTSFRPTYVWPEDMFVGWKSGGLFPDLGDDAIDISVGNQPLVLGDGLLFNGGAANGFGRAAYYIGPRAAFQKTAILKFDPSEIGPVRGTFFHAQVASNQSLMNGFDQPMTKVVGGSVDWYGPARQEPLGAMTDQWVVTGTYFQIYSADQAAQGSIVSNRNGLNVFSLRAAGSFFPADRDILFFGEYIKQYNNRSGRKTDATGWYVEPGYQFSNLPWAPMVTFRYANFSGDNDPTGGGTKRSYDPLFFGAGSRGLGPGTWFLGEIYGYYQQGLTNMNVQQVSVRATPSDSLVVGMNYYHINFNQLGQVNQLVSPGATVTSKRAMDEIDFYAEWSPTEYLTIVPTIGIGIPGAGYKQVDTGTGRSGTSTIFLGQVVASFKF